MTISKDSVKDVSKPVADIKNIITVDNVSACVGFRKVGVIPSKIEYPWVEESWKYPGVEVLGDKDGLTLKQSDKGLSKTFLNIRDAVKQSPADKREVDSRVRSKVVSLVFAAMSIATWPEFQAAYNAAPDGVVSIKAVMEAYHWLSAREGGCWYDGTPMGDTWLQHYQNMRSPVQVA